MITSLIIGLFIGAIIGGLLTERQTRLTRRNYRHRLASALDGIRNRDIYIVELQQRLKRQQQRVWIYVPDTVMADELETGPTSGVPLNLN